jgi:hypothetical protein
MLDSFADSSARLERLLELAMKEKDPIKCDEIAADAVFSMNVSS